MRRPLLACALVLFVPYLILAAPLRPLRVDAPPVIDGVLDDACWTAAPSVTDFKTFHPDYGLTPAAATIASMAYDDETLYFALRCLEDEPGKIKTSVTSRDNIRADDWVCINLDTFGDAQSLYAFYVNPNGVQGDSRFAGGVEDDSMDFVWSSAGRVDADGYVVEIAIPLASLRFAPGDETTMTVFFERYVSRRSEHASWPELDPDRGMNFLVQMHPLVYEGLRAERLFELLPAVTYGRIHVREEGELRLDDEREDLSLTAKMGLTTDLTLDAAWNPDFSQVEADAGQVDVNLRSPLFFAEKRPFFLEGREILRLGGLYVSERDPLRSVVHTRTIVEPHLGVKLNGKAGADNTVALLYAYDELPDGDEAHVPILRWKRALGGDSFLGATFTGRELDDASNRVAAVDGILRVSKPSSVSFSLLGSRSEADGDVREGHSYAASYRHHARDLEYQLSMREISEDFSVETGYVTRTGVRQFAVLAKPKLYPTSGAVQRIDIEALGVQAQDLPSDRWETFNHLSVLGLIGGSGQLKVKYSHSTEIFAGERFDTGGFHVFGGAQFTNWLYAGVLYRGVDAVLYGAEPAQGFSSQFTASLTVQPSDRIALDLSHVRFDFTRDDDGVEVYDYPITRGLLTYQPSRWFFVRGIVEYNDYRDELTTDLLASFTTIPGTVVHVGYGSLHDKRVWRDGAYVEDDAFHEALRGVFFKASYLWRI